MRISMPTLCLRNALRGTMRLGPMLRAMPQAAQLWTSMSVYLRHTLPIGAFLSSLCTGRGQGAPR